MRDIRRLIPLSSMRHGSEKGCICFEKQTLQWEAADNFALLGCVLIGHRPGHSNAEVQTQGALGSFGGSIEGVKDAGPAGERVALLSEPRLPGRRRIHSTGVASRMRARNGAVSFST